MAPNKDKAQLGGFFPPIWGDLAPTLMEILRVTIILEKVHVHTHVCTHTDMLTGLALI